MLTLAPLPLVLSFDLMSLNPRWRPGLRPSASVHHPGSRASLFGILWPEHLFPLATLVPPVFPQGGGNTAGVKLSLCPT